MKWVKNWMKTKMKWVNSFQKQQVLDSFKLKEFADDNFEV